MKKVLNNQKGMVSIANAIIMAGIVSVMMMSIAQMTASGIKSSKMIERSVNLSDLRGQIRQVISRKSYCDGALRTASNQIFDFVGEGTDIDKIVRDVNGHTIDILNIGEQVGYGTKAARIYLTYQTDSTTGDPVPPVINTATNQAVHWVKLNVDLESDGTVPVNFPPFKFSIVTHAPSGNFLGCSDLESTGTTGLHFVWIEHDLNNSGLDPNASCPSGYVYAGLADSNLDGRHSITEGTNALNPAGFPNHQILCGSAIAGHNWTGTGCSGGNEVDTGIRSHTSGDNRFNLNKGGGPLPSSHSLCWQGLSEVSWAPECRPGWAKTNVFDDNDAFHDLREYLPAGTPESQGQALQLCVR